MAPNPDTWEGLELASGRYRITDKLGEGGMGFVYKAFDTKRKHNVVIKVPNAMVLQNEDHRKRFEREYLTLRKLSHPNVVTIYEARKARQLGNIPYAVMQYLAGGDLSERLSNDPAKLREWLPAIAEALDYLHQNGHVHRDVKPGNILFDAEGKAYLSDFGIIKIARDAQNQETNLTATGMFIGTPHYMAPEIHDGETVGGQVDQYALAVIVYQALAKQFPFNGKTPIAIAVAHKTEQAAPIPEMFTEVNDAIMKGISKEPSQRYSSCVEFAEAVLSAVTIMIEQIKWEEEAVAKVREIEQEALEEIQRLSHEGGVYGPNSVLHLNYRNGQKKSSTHYKNGKQQGSYVAWHENGQKKSSTHYKNGKQHGPYAAWHENGQKEEEGYYKNGKQHGPYAAWHENGQKEEEGYYENGKQHGSYAAWHENGQKKSSTHYKNGKQHGSYAAWHENGQKETEGHYKDGERDGLWTEWHENGQKFIEGHYKDGEEEGLQTYWYENGQKETEGHYKDDERDGLWTEWHENGQKETEGHYKDGKQHGPYAAWHENGQKETEGHYKDGERDGLWTEWHENGQKKVEGHYKDGERDGLVTVWHENGQKKVEGHCKDGELDGLVTEWHENGQKKGEGHCKDGELDGLVTEWDENGKKTSEIEYKDGKEVSRKEF